MRNMLGLMGNIAEVDSLRPMLLRDDLLACIRYTSGVLFAGRRYLRE